MTAPQDDLQPLEISHQPGPSHVREDPEKIEELVDIEEFEED